MNPSLSATGDDGRMTYAQFLRAYPEGAHLEWVQGRVIEMPMASARHQDVGGFLLVLLRAFAEHHAAGRVFKRPFQMKVLPTVSRAPDLMIVRTNRLRLLRKYFLDGPADLVVEVVEANTCGIDRGDKFYEYEEGGVREYWLIDPQRKRAEFYRLGRDKQFHPMETDDEGIFRSVVLKGFWIRVEWLWQRPMPNELAVLRELGLV
jgi:Uma2 family endonuclease